MLPPERLHRIHVAFDDHRLVANAGLLLPVTLAHRLGLGKLAVRHVDLGDAPGQANAGDQVLTLVASALAGGDWIDDADALRSGGTAAAIGCVIKAPSTLGTFLRSFRWGHARQLDRVIRELPARAWAAGAGPGDDPLTIDLDATVGETYGLAREGARRHNYAGQRGDHPLFAIAAGSGDVLMARLGQGRAHRARGAANFLRETISRVRYAGATGPLTMRADSGFYNHDIVAAGRAKSVRFSIAVRQHQSLRNRIAAYPRRTGHPYPTGWWAPPTWLRLNVLPSSMSPTPRRDRKRHPRSQVRRGPQPPPMGAFPRQRRLAGRTELDPYTIRGHCAQLGPLDHAHRAGRAGGHHQDPAPTLLLPGRTHHPQSPPHHPASPPGLALAKPIQQCPGPIAPSATPFLTPRDI